MFIAFNMQQSGLWTVLCVLLPMCFLWPSFFLVLIVNLIPVYLVVFPNYPVFKSFSLSVNVFQVYFVGCVCLSSRFLYGLCMYACMYVCMDVCTYPEFDHIKSCWTLFLASSLLPAQSVTETSVQQHYIRFALQYIISISALFIRFLDTFQTLNAAS